MKISGLRRFCAVAALWGTFVVGAQAQYIWVDENGRKQYSDLPPPPSIPDSRILRQPDAWMPAAPASGPQAEPGKPAVPTLAERDAEFRKRRAERAEQEKKAQEEARVAAENKRHCERVRQHQKALESGVRMVRRDANGEQAFLDDADRKRELREARQVLAECK